MLALKEAGCSVVFQEQVSTRVKEENRPQFQAALSSLESGDELVVAKLDRLEELKWKWFLASTNSRRKASMSERWMGWSRPKDLASSLLF